MERYKREELSPQRVAAGLARRFADLPHEVTWAFSSGASVNKKRLMAFHNMHAGKRCVIIANGPSLAMMDLRPLAGEFTFGMNRIYLNFANMGFEPTYYVAINELVISQFKDEISRLKIQKFLNWSQRHHIPTNSRATNFVKLRLALRDTFAPDISKPISSGGTVTFVVLQLAFFMGFTEVVLIGLDHKFAAGGIPNIVEKRDKSNDASHFHPNYFPPGSRWQLPDLLRSELAYTKARQAFENARRRVLDATIDGACKVFDKVEFTSIWKK